MGHKKEKDVQSNLHLKSGKIFERCDWNKPVMRLKGLIHCEKSRICKIVHNYGSNWAAGTIELVGAHQLLCAKKES